MSKCHQHLDGATQLQPFHVHGVNQGHAVPNMSVHCLLLFITCIHTFLYCIPYVCTLLHCIYKKECILIPFSFVHYMWDANIGRRWELDSNPTFL